MTSAWTATPGDRLADAPDDSRVVGGQVAPAHPSKDAVVAGLERQVEVRQRPRRAVGPDTEQLVVDVLGLDRREADPLDVGLVERSADESGERERRARWAPRNPRSDQPPSYVPMLIPVRTISRWPARERASDVARARSPGRGSAPAPRAAGMMQYVQKNEQPSWTLTNARVRSTEARPSAMPSISTPDRVGSGATAAHRPRAGRPPPSRPAPPSSREQRVLRAVVDEARGRIGGRERLPPHLDRAAGHDDLRRPGSSVGPGGRHGATSRRPSEVTVQVLTRTRSARPIAVDDGDAALAEQARGRLHLGLVDLAAEVGDRGGPDRRRSRPGRRALTTAAASCSSGSRSSRRGRPSRS